MSNADVASLEGPHPCPRRSQSEEPRQVARPMRAALREAERLEWRLSDLVNEAYGVTPDEVRLMWATAPPRMPLAPDASTLEQAEDKAAK
jgi:hypothetical protein